MALTISTEWCSIARINTHTSTSCSFLTPLNISKPSKFSFNHKNVGSSNNIIFSWNFKKSLIGFKAITRHAFPKKKSMPKQDEENSGDEEDKWDYKKYQALLRGGEEVTSVLEEMIELLKDIAMDAKSEEVAVHIAAQGVVGRRVESLDTSFMMALDFMLSQSENEVSERKWLLEVIKDTVMSYMTRKLSPHAQVVGMLCRTPRKESRLELLRRVAGGGGTFDYETGGKVVLPKANLNDIANQADDLLETMEEKQAVPDRRLLARLVLVREEARSMMGGGILDERNHRGLSTLPQAEVHLLLHILQRRIGDAAFGPEKEGLPGHLAVIGHTPSVILTESVTLDCGTGTGSTSANQLSQRTLRAVEREKKNAAIAMEHEFKTFMEQTTQALQNITATIGNLRPNTRNGRERSPSQSESDNGTTRESTPRTNVPRFLFREEPSRGGEETHIPGIRELAAEYTRLDTEIKRSIPFFEFCEADSRRNYSKRRAQPNMEIQNKVGKMTIPNFDGCGEISVHSWIQN
ncbi:uncharacterized protein LOC131052791 [Cryptomeria japonica]|uniref:uncharacterized protein LOC131052791 n=1 Tax=Cryptomeria japonica TaxID=3369 RepID=UPI0025AD74A9|nr:uncharacterized protein LOC131052791 [Cryptomeria japonica]